MNVIMDGLLVAGAVFAGLYCFVLSRRVQALRSLDSGLGGAIVTLTRQIELARTTLEESRNATGETRRDLGDLIARSESAAAQLRLLLVATKEPVARGRSPRHGAAERMDRAERPGRGEPRLRDPDLDAETEAAPPPPPSASALREPLSARRRDGLGPRLVSLPQIAPAQPAPPVADPAPDDVPKPRRTQPLEDMIRNRQPDDPQPAETEDGLAAPGTIAAVGER